MISCPCLAKNLIPQQSPFVLIDELLYCDEQTAKTRFTIKSDTLFVENEKLNESGIVENIAQTSAARIGFLHQDQAKRIGVIGSVKNLEIFQLPSVDETVETPIEILGDVFGTLLVHAKVMCNQILMAEGEVKVAVTEQIAG